MILSLHQLCEIDDVNFILNREINLIIFETGVF